MKTPAWLQAVGLLLWGFAAGQGAVGALLAVARLIASIGGVRLNLVDRDLNRVVDLSTIAILLTFVGFLALKGLPKGLLLAAGWLPAALFPLLLTDALSETRLRLRHLAVTLRRSSHPDADRVANLGTPYLAMTILAAGVLVNSSPWFFWALAGLVLAWLFLMRPATGATGPAAFAIAAIVAVASGYATSLGLQRTQLALEEWVVDAMANTDSDPFQSQTRIGDVGRLKLSNRILWRVEQAPPAKVPLLLRDGVFNKYVNGTWVAQQSTFLPLASAPGVGRFRLALHGESFKGRAILPLPRDAGPVRGVPGSLRRNANGIVRIDEGPLLLDAVVEMPSSAAAIAPEAADLSLPSGFAGLLKRLPELAVLAQDREDKRLAGIKTWFALNFRYTLFLGDAQRGGRDLERFLLTDRAGHCEYFATSTVLLLRALGIPARYVTGYSVQEFSQLEKAFLIRQRHAHAWAEAFVDGEWVEVDTTPSAWLTVEKDAAPFWQPALDIMSFAWRRLVELRRDLADSEHPVGASTLGVILIFLLAWLALRHAKRIRKLGVNRGVVGKHDAISCEVLRSFHVLELELSALGLGRHLGEPPRTWLNRIAHEGASIIDEARIAKCRNLIGSLYLSRYGTS